MFPNPTKCDLFGKREKRIALTERTVKRREKKRKKSWRRRKKKIKKRKEKMKRKKVNPSNAKATFVQSTQMQIFFENHPNPVVLVLIRKLSLSTLRRVPFLPGFQ